VYLDQDGAAMTLLPATALLSDLAGAGFTPTGDVVHRESTISSGRRAVLVGVFGQPVTGLATAPT
jgi:hypothetical protein